MELLEEKLMRQILRLQDFGVESGLQSRRIGFVRDRLGSGGPDPHRIGHMNLGSGCLSANCRNAVHKCCRRPYLSA